MAKKFQSTEVKAIIFDYAGVLTDQPTDRWTAFEKEHHLEVGSFLKTLASPELAKHYTGAGLGKISMKEYESIFVETYKRQYNCKEESLPIFTELLNEKSAPCIPQMIELILKLRKAGYKTALLTNTAFKDRNKAETMCFADHSWFDVIVESCVEGMRKPEQRIYELVLDRLKCTAFEAVFIDDLSANLKPAAEMGMKTILFENASQSIDELERVLDVPLASNGTNIKD